LLRNPKKRKGGRRRRIPNGSQGLKKGTPPKFWQKLEKEKGKLAQPKNE